MDLSFLTWKAWAAALGLSTIVAAGGGFYAGHHWAGDDLANLKAQYSARDAAAYKAALQKFTDLSERVTVADSNYGETKIKIDANFAAMRKQLQEALKAKPLPKDCAPDEGRLNALNEAVDVTNSVLQ